MSRNEFNGFNTKCGKAIKLVCFIETHSLREGTKKFGKRGEEANMSEMKQLHDREAFTPTSPQDMTPSEQKKTLESLMFLMQKRCGRIKARTHANGSAQREWMSKEDATSPTAAVEAMLLTAVIDAKENRKVITVDAPNAFIHTAVGNDKDGDRITMKMRGPIVNMLVSLDHNLCNDKVVTEDGQKALCVHVKKAIYGMTQSSLLFYQKPQKDLDSDSFKIKPHDPCVANKMVNGKQLTVVWHVDVLKVTHQEQQMLDNLLTGCRTSAEAKKCQSKPSQAIAMTALA